MNDKETAKKQAITNNENIKKFIKSQGYKMTQVAEGIGVNKVSFAQYLNGDMSVTKLQSIANFLGCSIDELLKGERDENKLYCPHCGKPLNITLS